MRFMMIVKACKESEAGVMPSRELVEAMGRYNEELMSAGVLLAGDGLQSSAMGARVYIQGDKRRVVDGPFPETKELIAGFWIIDVKSKAEAIEWALKVPAPHESEEETNIELRQFFEVEDFPPEVLTPEQAEKERALGERLRR